MKSFVEPPRGYEINITEEAETARFRLNGIDSGILFWPYSGMCEVQVLGRGPDWFAEEHTLNLRSESDLLAFLGPFLNSLRPWLELDAVSKGEVVRGFVPPGAEDRLTSLFDSIMGWSFISDLYCWLSVAYSHKDRPDSLIPGRKEIRLSVGHQQGTRVAAVGPTIELYRRGWESAALDIRAPGSWEHLEGFLLEWAHLATRLA